MIHIYEHAPDTCEAVTRLLWILRISSAPLRMPLQTMAKYNALFQHLLRLKRLNGELDAAWASLRRQAGAESLQSRQPIWDVRLHMAHLLLNLQVYMQARADLPMPLQSSAPISTF